MRAGTARRPRSEFHCGVFFSSLCCGDSFSLMTTLPIHPSILDNSLVGHVVHGWEHPHGARGRTQPQGKHPCVCHINVIPLFLPFYFLFFYYFNFRSLTYIQLAVLLLACRERRNKVHTDQSVGVMRPREHWIALFFTHSLGFFLLFFLFSFFVPRVFFLPDTRRTGSDPWPWVDEPLLMWLPSQGLAGGRISRYTRGPP